MRHAVSHSIWLVPEDQATFAHVIERLGRGFGGPTFVPHITLLGGFPGARTKLLQQARTLARQLAPLKVQLGPPAFGGEFFYSCFLPALPGDELASAHQLAEKVFERQERNYRPHLSLYYGDIEEQDHERFSNVIANDLPNTLSFNRIYLAYNDEPNLRWELIESFALEHGDGVAEA